MLSENVIKGKLFIKKNFKSIPDVEIVNVKSMILHEATENWISF